MARIAGIAYVKVDGAAYPLLGAIYHRADRNCRARRVSWLFGAASRAVYRGRHIANAGRLDCYSRRDHEFDGHRGTSERQNVCAQQRLYEVRPRAEYPRRLDEGALGRIELHRVLTMADENIDENGGWREGKFVLALSKPAKPGGGRRY